MVIRCTMSNIERRGRWEVPPAFEIRAKMGNVELDFRETVVPPEVVIDLRLTMGNLELTVPRDVRVIFELSSVASHVADSQRTAEPGGPVIRITGKLKFGNIEVHRLAIGETPSDVAHASRIERHRARHRRWRELHEERELWRRDRHRRHRHQKWMPWWLLGKMRRRIFLWLALALGMGVVIGYRLVAHPEYTPWWWIVIGLVGLSIMSGAIAWRLTRPLVAVIGAARDIGDGKLETRIAVDEHGGETRMLAVAINDMAAKIQQQMADQRQLLAAVSHELRTPLGHMRVLVETARDTGDVAKLAEVDREILVLDDLVGKLLAQSRLEFGNLDRRRLDLGELVSDAATSAGIAPEVIEAHGDVHAPVDPTLVRRAVANLLENARRHGGGAVAVRIERRDGQIRIEVDDAGPGVPADRRADAFRAFVPSSGGGLGLGLALVSRIAVAHGGGAWIDERPAGGARVGFSVAAIA